MKQLKFGILTGSESYSEQLVKTIESRGHTCRIIDPAKIYQLITESERGYDRLYDGSAKGDEPDRITANSLDVVINRLGSGADYGASVLRFMVENLGIYCPNDPAGIIFAGNKAWSLQRLSSLGIRVPRSVITQRPNHINWILDKIGGSSWVIKTVFGSQGRGVAIAHEKRSAASLFEFCYNARMKIIIESFVPSDGQDVRAWVVGDRVAVAMQRTAKPGDWKANISQGGSGKKIELSSEDQELCVKASHALGLNISGVDLIRNKDTGESMIVEVNSNPGTHIIGITGYNPFEDIVTYCEENYNKTAVRSTPATPDSVRSAEMEIQLRTANNLVETLQTELKDATGRLNYYRSMH
jgi:ribosomal protein S6--L-glutamate ligase